MRKYKAIVTDKMTGKATVIESEQNSKAEFIHDLRRNGYSVNADKVKREDVFDYIMEYTDCYPWDWKIRKVPEKESENGPKNKLYWFTCEELEDVLVNCYGSLEKTKVYADDMAYTLKRDVSVNLNGVIVYVAHADVDAERG